MVHLQAKSIGLRMVHSLFVVYSYSFLDLLFFDMQRNEVSMYLRHRTLVSGVFVSMWIEL